MDVFPVSCVQIIYPPIPNVQTVFPENDAKSPVFFAVLADRLRDSRTADDPARSFLGERRDRLEDNVRVAEKLPDFILSLRIPMNGLFKEINEKKEFLLIVK